MRAASTILISLLIVLNYNSCIQNESMNAEIKDVSKDIFTIEKYTFVNDTNEIRNLVEGEVKPDGYFYNPKDLINRYIKLYITNNTLDTIFFSKPYSSKPNNTKSSILCYSPLVGYSNDSLNWQRFKGVRDYFCPFTEPVLSNETTIRYLYVDSIEKYKYFQFSIHYELKKEITKKVVVLKLSK